MNLNDYQTEAMSFRLPAADNTYALHGLVGEVGELYSAIAKAIRDDAGVIDTTVLRKELGDILWFIAALSSDFGFELSDVAQGNIDKLSSRKTRGVIQGSGDDR